MIPTHDEARAMIAAASPRVRPLVATALMTGLRSSELRALSWDDVDLDRKVITVRRRADRWGGIGSPKSAASRRDVPLPAPPRVVLRSRSGSASISARSPSARLTPRPSLRSSAIP
ncbi:MAG TPA: tyrosine-type recombinase/integrase [Geminicoccaceae bacterium]